MNTGNQIDVLLSGYRHLKIKNSRLSRRLHDNPPSLPVYVAICLATYDGPAIDVYSGNIPRNGKMLSYVVDGYRQTLHQRNPG